MAQASLPELHTEFTYRGALGYEPGISRRDPSPVIRVGTTYYVWYSKSLVDASGYHASVWYATSKDGSEWAERGEAIGKGGTGQWDENGVFTPTVLTAEGRVYLYYTAVPRPFTNDKGGPRGTPTAIGVAIADATDGPWFKCDGNPILRPGPAGAFDSHRVDDACLIVRGGRYWLYYKGRQAGMGPGQTKMGLAIADAPAGPYEKYEGNPVLDSGHEVCVWPHRQGVAALVAPTGPQGSTVQYSADGLHFRPASQVEPPSAPGPYRTDTFQETPFGNGITWGICQDLSRDRPFLKRFDCDLSQGDASQG